MITAIASFVIGYCIGYCLATWVRIAVVEERIRKQEDMD